MEGFANNLYSPFMHLHFPYNIRLPRFVSYYLFFPSHYFPVSIDIPCSSIRFPPFPPLPSLYPHLFSNLPHHFNRDYIIFSKLTLRMSIYNFAGICNPETILSNLSLSKTYQQYDMIPQNNYRKLINWFKCQYCAIIKNTLELARNKHVIILESC